MRVHVDVTHPAHVHLFRPTIETLAEHGHDVAVTSRDKEVTTDLLDAEGIEHCVLSTKRSSQLALGPEWALRAARTLEFVRTFDPDVVLTQLNPASVVAAAASDASCVVFHDSETAGTLAKALAPLADRICSPTGVHQALGDHHEHYEGFHELAYLHPDRFEADPDVLRAHDVDPVENYAVLRTVSMGAYHDVGADGLSQAEARRLAEELSEYGRVYVSSEGEPPSDLPADPVPVPPAAIHHLLAEASVFVGDSDTMAIEAGILGTPSVRVDCFGEGTLGCFDELERYDLVHSTTDDAAARERAVGLAADPEAEERWAQRRDDLLDDKVDVTAYALDVVYEEAGVDPEASDPKRTAKSVPAGLEGQTDGREADGVPFESDVGGDEADRGSEETDRGGDEVDRGSDQPAHGDGPPVLDDRRAVAMIEAGATATDDNAGDSDAGRETVLHTADDPGQRPTTRSGDRSPKRSTDRPAQESSDDTTEGSS